MISKVPVLCAANMMLLNKARFKTSVFTSIVLHPITPLSAYLATTCADYGHHQRDLRLRGAGSLCTREIMYDVPAGTIAVSNAVHKKLAVKINDMRGCEDECHISNECLCCQEQHRGRCMVIMNAIELNSKVRPVRNELVSRIGVAREQRITMRNVGLPRLFPRVT